MYLCVRGISYVYVCQRYQLCICVLEVSVMYLCVRDISYVYVCQRYQLCICVLSFLLLSLIFLFNFQNCLVQNCLVQNCLDSVLVCILCFILFVFTVFQRMNFKLTDQKKIIENGKVPFPLYSCLHVKRQVSAMIFNGK